MSKPLVDKKSIITSKRETMNNKMKKWMELLTMYNHEMRAPLWGINGFSQILLEENDNFTDEQIEMIENINKSCHRVIHTIGDMMTTAFLLLDEKKPMFENVDLETLFLKTEHTLNAGFWMAGYRTFKFIIECDGNIDPVVADRNLLLSMFLWLFSRDTYNYQDSEKVNTFFIHLKNNSSTIEISISNIFNDDGKKTHSNFIDLWKELIDKILSIHAGQIFNKTDGNGKTFIEITLPVEQE